MAEPPPVEKPNHADNGAEEKPTVDAKEDLSALVNKDEDPESLFTLGVVVGAGYASDNSYFPKLEF